MIKLIIKFLDYMIERRLKRGSWWIIRNTAFGVTRHYRVPIWNFVLYHLIGATGRFVSHDGEFSDIINPPRFDKMKHYIY